MAAPRHATDWEALSLRVVFGVLAAIAIVFLVGPTEPSGLKRSSAPAFFHLPKS